MVRWYYQPTEITAHGEDSDMDKTLIAIAVCLVGGGGEVVVLLVGSWIIDRRNARRRAVA